MSKPLSVSLTLALFLISCSGESPRPAVEEPVEHLGGGDATVQEITSDAFSAVSANVTEISKIKSFNLGNDFFQNPWVAGSASTSSRDGLGGLFNNNACQDCHIRDGRGQAPNVSETEDGTNFSSTLIRASRSQISQEEQSQMMQGILAVVPDTAVGPQMQHDAVAGVPKEVALSVTYEPIVVTFADGETQELRNPTWHMQSLYEGQDFDADSVFSVRVAQPMIGLGLLELIDEQTITAKQDPNDEDGDGISGKAQHVWSAATNRVMLGRFGWKAGQPTVLDQSVGAFLNDMGLTSRVLPNESCQPHQIECQNTPNGNGDSVNRYEYEVPDAVLDAVVFYASNLAVPQRRDAYSDQVQRGKSLFFEAGCEGCHTESYTTESSESLVELSNQVIFPYTDLLLHDMGEALADFNFDGSPADAAVLNEFQATTREWRTPPLWGIGLSKAVNPNATFLHDGRARTILEAVVWHGGEAQAARDKVVNEFTTQEREDLMRFLNDL